MVGLIIVLVILAALGILGAVVKGLLWLTVVAVVLFVIGGFFGWTKFKGAGNS